MTDHAPFLRRIIESPDDDLPRLVYADALEEAGDAARGEFVRVQVELATEQPHWGWRGPGYEAECDRECDCRWHVLRSREGELLEGFTDDVPHSLAWSGLRFTADSARWNYYFVRGFVSHVTLSWDDWLQHADALCAATPLREVTLRTMPAAIRRWRDRPVTADDRPGIIKVLAAEWPGIKFNPPPRSASVSMAGLPFLESAARDLRQRAVGER